MIYVVGAGGFGREVAQWAFDTGVGVDGFLDSDPCADPGGMAPIVGGDDFPLQPEDRLLCGIGEPALKRIVCERFIARGAKFLTLIHPTAVVPQEGRLGEGCIICPHAVVSVNALVGRLVTVNCSATVGHDAIVGDWCSISSHADICGKAKLGEGVLMGSHAVVLPRAVAGDWSIVGSGSVVVKEAPPKSTVLGVPAQVIYRSRQ